MGETDPRVEIVARAMCETWGLDPNDIMANDGPRWRYYVHHASYILAALAAARPNWADGNRPLPLDRDTLGRMVREAWVRWAMTQPHPKPSWLVPYDDLPEPDKEADRQIGEAVARWTLIHDAARVAARPVEPPPLRSQWHEYTPVKVGSSAPRPVEPQLTPETAPTMADMQRMTDDLLTDPAAMDAYMDANPLAFEPPADEEVAEVLAEYVELNMNNYTDDDVAILNAWGGNAADLIERQQAENARMTRERDEAERQMIAWRSAVQSCTPGGSEFMSPQAVRDWLQKMKTDRSRAIASGVANAQRATAAEAEVADLRARLAKTVEALMAHHNWHQQIGAVLFPAEEGQTEPTEIDLSAEYADSTLCEQTCTALAQEPST